MWLFRRVSMRLIRVRVLLMLLIRLVRFCLSITCMVLRIVTLTVRLWLISWRRLFLMVTCGRLTVRLIDVVIMLILMLVVILSVVVL